MIEDSSFHLNAPENAVNSHKVSILIEHGALTVSVEREGTSRNLILDTGSTILILQSGLSRSDIHVTAVETYGMTGDIQDITGQQSVTFRLNGREFTHSLVCLLRTKAAGLLGTNYLDRLGAIVDFECGELSLTSVDKMLRVCNIPVKRHATHTYFPRVKQAVTLAPYKNRRGEWTNSSQPAPALRQLPQKRKFGL